MMKAPSRIIDYYKQPLICIVFDDAYKSDYTVAFPGLLKRDLKGTSYIISNNIGASSGWLNVSEVRTMKRQGWDIECHTFTGYSDLRDKSDSIIEQEAIKANEYFEKTLRIAGSLHTAFHASATSWDENVKELFKPHRLSLRRASGNQRLIDYDDFDMFDLSSLTGDVALKDDSRLEVLKENVDQAIRDTKILYVYFHKISNDEEKERFRSFLDYVVESGIKSVTRSELYFHLLPHVK